MQNPGLEHQKLVISLINHFKKNLGFTILNASYNGFSEPNKHGRHEPDIVAIDKNRDIHLAEAKVENDIFSEQAREQFVDFSDRITTATKRPVTLHIIVYKKDEPALISVLNQNGLGQKIGNIIKIWTLPS